MKQTPKMFAKLQAKSRTLSGAANLRPKHVMVQPLQNYMKIFVKAKPNAREEKLVKVDETHFVVAVKEPPIKGKANAAIARALAEYFGVPPSFVSLVSGFTSREKVFEILT